MASKNLTLVQLREAVVQKLGEKEAAKLKTRAELLAALEGPIPQPRRSAPKRAAAKVAEPPRVVITRDFFVIRDK